MSRRTRLILVEPLSLHQLPSDTDDAGVPRQNFRLTTADGAHFCEAIYQPTWPGQIVDLRVMHALCGMALQRTITGKVRRGEPA